MLTEITNLLMDSQIHPKTIVENLSEMKAFALRYWFLRIVALAIGNGYHVSIKADKTGRAFVVVFSWREQFYHVLRLDQDQVPANSIGWLSEMENKLKGN